ncbi:porin family protein [Xanthomarina sp. F2636L]|uniref:porin family protein n=1 Tax=Xanthomarina sp. F2636L TaxID=2996018 RepID=UPI00225E3D4F|nr:porin family protein [Xanthomarina sp. F2636L]MCX7551607.1 porin family protein [Xanthomarina sp. F2636L]
MKLILAFLMAFCCTATVYSQEVVVDSTQVVDTKYKEDQFYLAITYNLLANKPDNVKQTGFSSGFHFGYIRDFPLNERRNFGIGLGLGASINSYNHNIFVFENEAGNIEYTNLSDADISYSKNKFSTYLLELPFEIRWRTSTATEYRFWRVYPGFKVGYLLASATKYKGELGTIKNSNIKDFNKFQYGLTLSTGYNTWNFHIYYSLNSILSKDATLGPDTIDMSAVKFGLIFYIL